MKMTRWMAVICFCLCLAGMNPALAGSQQNLTGEPPADTGCFEMEESTGANQEPLRVYYYRPGSWQGDDPVLIVMHGMKRNAADYLRHWRQHAEDHRLLLLCPEMDERKYPGSRYYNLGNVMDREDAAGILQPEQERVFPVMDRIFEEAKRRFGVRREGFSLYGHSAGAQFVHRYLLFSPQSRAESIISANAGWYTMPDEAVRFPYGLGGTEISTEQLTKAFARPVTILLGEEDTDPRHPALRRNPEADRQGTYRLERGKNFFEAARQKAETMGVPFRWQLRTVPGAAHSDSKMAQAAIRVVAGETPDIIGH